MDPEGYSHPSSSTPPPTRYYSQLSSPRKRRIHYAAETQTFLIPCKDDLRYFFEPDCSPECYYGSYEDQMPSYAPKEDVMMDPKVFRQACEILQVNPTVDLFASARHHQLPQYFGAVHDRQALGIDAFRYDWRKFYLCYANPPGI